MDAFHGTLIHSLRTGCKKMAACWRLASLFIVEELVDDTVLDAADIIQRRNKVLSKRRQKENRSYRVS